MLNTIKESKKIKIITTDEAQYIYLKASSKAEGKSSPIQLIFKKWIALSRPAIFWMSPCFGADISQVPTETQFLLLELENNKFGLLLPTIDCDTRTTIIGAKKAENSVNLVWAGDIKKRVKEDTLLAIYIEDDCPYNIVKKAMTLLKRKLKSFELIDYKKEADFTKHLGWCTWDAFYQTVSHKDVIAGLKSFQKGGITIGYMILDDGWLDATEERKLLSFKANSKFPDGLEGLIKESKDKFGLKYFGVWHAFQGYWQGIDPKTLGKTYRTINNNGYIRPWEKENEIEVNLSMIVPDDIYRFYHDFHRSLASEGVDFIKVDNQSALESFSKNHFGRCTAMRNYQEALQSSVEFNFHGQSIHCMSNSSDVAFNMKTATVWRNSDDYLPKAGLWCQKHHILTNTFNALWTSSFSTPDWDMFQSHGPNPEFHAASRAISGGPVYVCDSPNKQNFSIIDKLIDQNGLVYKADRAALPAQDCIFTDVENTPKVLKITNIVKDAGVIGLFNVTDNAEELVTSYTAKDIHDLKGNKFVAYSFINQKISLVNKTKTLESKLGLTGFDIITFAPVKNITALGLKEKYLGIAAVVENNHENNEFTIRGKGTALFYVNQKVSEIKINGKKSTKWIHHPNGLIEIPINKSSTIVFS
ncbi:MAG: Sip1-related alpha-galactosidase [Kiritimatiellae bacterium]|jgi:raffinose synthase|nr:Sip1-related alpha-galactosidase [Kiritimatiellia bacterium]